MICSAQALLDETPKPSDEQIRRALGGNLCRCTGYTKIFEAVKLAADNEDLGGLADTGTDGLQVPISYDKPADGYLVLGSRGHKADSIRKAIGTEICADDIELPRMAPRASCSLPGPTRASSPSTPRARPCRTSTP